VQELRTGPPGSDQMEGCGISPIRQRRWSLPASRSRLMPSPLTLSSSYWNCKDCPLSDYRQSLSMILFLTCGNISSINRVSLELDREQILYFFSNSWPLVSISSPIHSFIYLIFLDLFFDSDFNWN